MSPTTPTLESLGIDKLPADQRVELAHAILESVDAELARFEQSDAFKREIDRRLAAHAADPSKAVPWEVVKARALARWAKP
jgi:putative addiction module component (TIGR02574 family)